MDSGQISLVVSVSTVFWTIAWAIYQHRVHRRDRREDREERVRAVLSLEHVPTGATLVVELTNVGGVPITVDKVQMAWQEHAATKETGIPFTMAMSFEGPPEIPVRRKAFYRLRPERFDAELREKLAGLAPGEVWIAVRSESAEILRHEGPLLEILKQINVLAKANFHEVVRQIFGSHPTGSDETMA